jgi:hypothetical protein
VATVTISAARGCGGAGCASTGHDEKSRRCARLRGAASGVPIGAGIA